MANPLRSLLILLLLGSCVPRCDAADDPRDVIEKAILAQGGEKAVSKLKAMRRLIKGTLVVDPRFPAVPMTYEDVWQLPRQFKSTMAMVARGASRRRIEIISGNAGWISEDGKTERLTAETHAELLEGRYAESLECLFLLRDKTFDLSMANEAALDGKPALGIRVRAQGHRDVTLYFDKETMLLVKRVNEVKYPDGSTHLMEAFFSDHKDFEGVRLWAKAYACMDEKKFVEGEVVSIAFPETIDNSEFGQPAHGPEKAWSVQQRAEWLWKLANDADRSRKYAVAEAYMNGVLTHFPEDGYVLGTLACFVGKQERYQEALNLTTLAEKSERRSDVQLAGIKAAWLAHLGRKDEAEKIWTDLPVPPFDDRTNYEMYYACQAFYAARIEKSAEKLKKAMAALFGDRCSGHWLAFLENDISFDDYRTQQWFKEAVVNARNLLKD